jgi:hypothetical protein
VLLALAAVPGSASAAADDFQMNVFQYDGRLGRIASHEVQFVFPRSKPAPAKIVTYLPRGYSLNLALAPDTRLGLACARVVQNGRAAWHTGGVDVVDPRFYETDPAAQVCAPGPQAAVWLASFNLPGVPPIIFYVGPTTDAEASRGAFRIVACLPRPAGDVGRLLVLDLDLQSTAPLLRNPAAQGQYTWRAFITPYVPGTGSADEGATVEVRAYVPLPHRLIAKATYDRKREVLAIRGKLLGAGKPRSGIFLAAYLSIAGWKYKLLNRGRTGGDGTFLLQRRVARKPFDQSVELGVNVNGIFVQCVGPYEAPGGCVDAGEAGLYPALMRLVIPRRR